MAAVDCREINTLEDALVWCDSLEDEGQQVAWLREHLREIFFGYGNGDGYGNGNGDGYGYGDGDGYGDGNGDGYG